MDNTNTTPVADQPTMPVTDPNAPVAEPEVPTTETPAA